MRNWSTDTSKFNKQSPEYEKWKLEQLINYGLQGEKIDKEKLKKYLPEITIDPSKRTFLEFLLYNVKTN